MVRSLMLTLLATVGLATGLAVRTAPTAPPKPSAERLRAHVEFLADDLLEGRGTGTRGYDLAARYAESQFAALGLEPAGTGGGFWQPVPFLAARPVEDQCSLALVRGGATEPLVYRDDYLMRGDWLRDRWTLEAPAVYVGFGVSAPELGYDDYAGLDVRGKVVVMARGAPRTFPNDQRAYHAWQQLKDETAAAHGAAGTITFRLPEESRRMSWERIARMGVIPAMRWTDAEGRPHDTFAQLELDAVLGPEGVAKLFRGAPEPLDTVLARAAAGRPKGFELAVTVKAKRATNRWRVSSPNVAALLRGSDPVLAKEVVVVSAHLDHLGIGAPVNGDSIHNGAYDNASGSACTLELARLLRSMPRAPKRSVLFLLVTGEEKGLQGAEYFTQFPTIDDEIVANLNLDMFLLNHPMRNVVAFGAEHSSLGGVAARAAAAVGANVIPDPAPEEVVFIRSDQFPFIRRGVPALFPEIAGADSAEAALDGEWYRTRYHQPSDDLGQTFDWAAGAKFTDFAMRTLLEIANAPKRPTWNPGDFFGERFRPKP